MRSKSGIRFKVATILTIVLGVAAVAEASTWTSGSGAACQGEYDTTHIVRNIGDTYGNSSGSTNLFCPISLGTVASVSVPVQFVLVAYHDANSGSPFGCHVEQEVYPSTAYWSSAMYTCATPGGCSVPSTFSFVGDNYLQINSLATGQLTHRVDDNYTVVCTVPGIQNGAASGVLSYYAFSG